MTKNPDPFWRTALYAFLIIFRNTLYAPSKCIQDAWFRHNRRRLQKIGLVFTMDFVVVCGLGSYLK